MGQTKAYLLRAGTTVQIAGLPVWSDQDVRVCANAANARIIEKTTGIVLKPFPDEDDLDLEDGE